MTATVAVVDRTGVLLDAVRSSAAGLTARPSVEAVRRPTDSDLGGVRADVLVLGPRELTAAGLGRVLRWSSAHPDSLVVAHLGTRGTPAPAARELRAAGVTHWYRGAPDATRLEELLADALEVRQEQARDEALLEEPTSATRVPGTVLAVTSPTGGSGKTLLATNLAASLARRGRRTLLVDLDLQFGEVAAALQIRHQYCLYDGLYDAHGEPLPAGALEEHFDELVTTSPAGFDVLLAPKDPGSADMITGEHATRALELAADRYDAVVVDTRPSLDAVQLAAIDMASLLAVIVPLDVPSLSNLTAYLEVLDQLGVEQSRRRLVLNKVDRDIGIDVSQAQKVFGGRFVATLPVDRAASRCLNTGRLVLQAEPRTPLGKALGAACAALLPSLPAEPAGVQPARPSPRRRLRALLHSARNTPGGPS